MYIITLRHAYETTVVVESNKYCIFLCVCARARACVQVKAFVCVRECVWVGVDA